MNNDDWDSPDDRETGFAAKLQKEQIALSKGLRRLTSGSESELLFDRKTGKLFVGNARKRNLPDDVIPATEMAKEGFFSR